MTPAAEAAREAVERAASAIARAFPSAAVHVGLSDPATGLRLGLRDREKVHAASTMKLPGLLEARRRVAEGELRFEQAVPLHNRFASLEGGHPYALDAAEDSDPDLHLRLGGEAALGELLERMIVRSSNLATNLVLELVPPPAVTRLCRSLGASDIEVLRGVEDAAAFRAGRNNLATAHDLVVLLEALAERRAGAPRGRASVCPRRAHARLSLGGRRRRGRPRRLGGRLGRAARRRKHAFRTRLTGWDRTAIPPASRAASARLLPSAARRRTHGSPSRP